MGRKKINLRGHRIGRWRVRKMVSGDTLPVAWKCVCDCGTVATVLTSSLRAENGSRSCGCLARELTSTRNRTHGKTGSRIHEIWMSMLKRCSLTKWRGYKDYGGRGIRVVEAWKDFQTFHADMGDPPSEKHQLDRIDNNGNYSKENCRWSTVREQSINRRSTRFLELDGVRKCITDWGLSLGITETTLRQRLERGWSLKEALTTKKLR